MKTNEQQSVGRKRGYAWYVVSVLMLAYVFSFIDRQILSLLVAPIRRDLNISDTQMSLLIGFSFAVFYTVCGIPLGRLADYKSRRSIIGVGILFWSSMMAACGLARQYWQFLLARAGVGVGEATLSPSAYSMIADYFPPQRRATALSVYSMGIYIGAGVAFLTGGLMVKFFLAKGDMVLPLVGTTRPWQLIFYILGAAGLPVALLLFSVAEPMRRYTSGAAAPRTSLGDCLRYMRRHVPTLACHNIGFGLLSLAGYASLAWVPTVFIRNYGWTAGQAGVVYGSLIMVFGSAGVVAGGAVADRLAQRGRTDAAMRVGLYAGLAWLPFALAFPLLPNGKLAAVVLAPAAFCSAMPFGVAPAALQDMMPSTMRAQASAVYLFVLNLIGLGVGPTAVALITDRVFHNDKAVGQSLVIASAAALVSACSLLWLGLKFYRRSLAQLKDWEANPASALAGIRAVEETVLAAPVGHSSTRSGTKESWQ